MTKPCTFFAGSTGSSSSNSAEAFEAALGGVGVWDAAVVVGVGVSEGPTGALSREDGVRQDCIFDGGVCQTIVYEDIWAGGSLGFKTGFL